MTQSIAQRLWNRDTSVYTVAAQAAVRDAILGRLGWLTAPQQMRASLAAIHDVATACSRDGITHLALLGMGGSSLCAEVLRHTLVPQSMRERMLVLDTTDERAVRTASAVLPPTSTLFVVASKSGSTIEVTALEAWFRDWLRRNGVERPGRHMIAITDPGTDLVAHAAAHGYRHTFINPADVGGRFSALSLFGLVPAALMGIAPSHLLDAADRMVEACRGNDDHNPGVALGTFMATHARNGRDKLTIELPPSLQALGLWIEQLVAESTGKLGRGVLPIVDEPLSDDVNDYGSDRAFVLVGTSDSPQVSLRRRALEAAGHPTITLDATTHDLGAEFFRWEFATAVAGAQLDVNPFDEPNVRDAKTRTSAILSRPDVPEPPGLRHHGRADLRDVPPHSYVAILDYLPHDADRAETVARVREHLRARLGVATTYGAGPRYLHSTGQYHKGGTNNGVFVLLTATDASASQVPDAPYTFSRLKLAQALGDFDALVANDRMVIHVHHADANAPFSHVLEHAVLHLLE